MKLNHLLSFGATASLATLLAVSGISQIGNASPSLEESNILSVSPSFIIAQQAGNFVAAEAPTTGSAKIVEENGKKYLEIDSAFSTTDQAPDLQVLLDTVAQPPAHYQDSDANRYLNLGGLQNVTGEQRYPIPDFVDETQFKSVVIWCRMANATIGYAPISK